MEKLQLSPGSLFGNRFEIERAAGSGGMGTVYRAIDRYDSSVVALKILHLGQNDSDERFEREAELLAQLRHPGIVSHVAHGRTLTGQRFLAMEWLEGQDLGQRLARGPLPLRDCLLLLAQIADALAIAHARGVIHRDIKPANLFLVNGDTARVKILDFGIARRAETAQGLTRTGMVVGTPEYMAPEQARGSRDLTVAADMFSLGCVLYECLTGTPPFVADHVAAVLVRILFEEPPALEERRPGLPAPVMHLVEQLLRKDRDRRLPDAIALRSELASIGDVPEPPPAVTLASPSLSSTPFADGEQSLVSVVLAAPPEDAVALGATLPQSAVRLEGAARRALIDAIAALGAVADFLANGALVVTVPKLESAHDQAMLAARSALCIKSQWPEAAVSVATGRGLHRGRTAVGEVVERAAQKLHHGRERLGGPEKAGVLLDSLSAKLLEGRFAQAPQPDGALLLGEEKETDASRPLLGKPTPCVGREAELSTLEAQLASCLEDCEARAILITAPPGVGKSRLRHEFLRRVERKGEPITILLGRGDLLQAGAAYGIMSRAIRGLCGLAGGEPLDTQRQRLRARLTRHLAAAEADRLLPFLGELCGVPFSEQEYPVLREVREIPKLLPERLRRACLSWLAAECQAAPVMIILDDLHWGDELTVALLDEALRELRSACLFVFALGRPELHTNFPSLWRAHKPHEIALKGVSKRACERLIQQTLGTQIAPHAIEWMVEQSAGNALFLEELIRAAAEGNIERRPDTVIAMLQARIGHLAAGPRHAALAASVFGQTLWHGGVARLLGLSEYAPEVQEWMHSLIEAEILEAHGSSRIPEQHEYGFRHALVRDAAYGLLTEPDLRLGHNLAAEFLESRIDAQIPIAALGHHFRQAGLLDKSRSFYLQAGDRAAKLSLFEEARLHYATVLEIADEQPPTTELRRLQADILIKQVQCSLFGTSPEVNFQRVARARDILNALKDSGLGDSSDRLRVARLDYCSGRLFIYTGQQGQAAPYFFRVLPLGQELQDQELILLPSLHVASALVTQGQIHKAIATLEPVVAPMERTFGKDFDTLRSYMWLAFGYGHTLCYADSVRLIEHVRPWVDEIQQAAYSGIFHVLSSLAALAAGDWPTSVAISERGITYGLEAKEALIQYLCWDASAWAHSHLGNHQSAQECRRRALELRRPFGGGMTQDYFEAAEAEQDFLAGRIEDALKRAEQVATTSRQAGFMASLAVAERVWGRALAQLGADPTEVDAHLRAGVEVGSTTGLVMDAVWTELAWGQLCLTRGNRDAAERHFQQVQDRMTDKMPVYTRQEILRRISCPTAGSEPY